VQDKASFTHDETKRLPDILDSVMVRALTNEALLQWT